jgi:hypothetical protein
MIISKKRQCQDLFMIRVPIYKIALSAVISLTLNTYAQQDTLQVEDRVNGILPQMTLAG